MTTKLTDKNISNVSNLGISWQAVKTTAFNAVVGEGYFVNTTSGVVTVTLPSSANAGDTIAIKDYAGTFATNNLTIARNGHNIQGVANNSLISTNRANVELAYIDSTKGWLFTNESNVADLQLKLYVTATGGTVATSGDYKIHSFTGDGCFVVSVVGNPAGSDTVDYLVVAGGGGGGSGAGNGGGGGGAGGVREGYNPGSYTASPLVTSALPVTATGYPITVGGGGALVPASGNGTTTTGATGSNSVFSTITSAGGGGGAGGNNAVGVAGGSGGGAGGGGQNAAGGAGNTPPVSPSQGNTGGAITPAHSPDIASSGGGGAGGTGKNNGADTTPQGYGTNGGIGVTTSINGTATGYGGGGGGSAYLTPSGGRGNDHNWPNGGAASPGIAVGATTAFGGGRGGNWNNPGSGTNKGGGGGGTGYNNTGAGGSGIVIIRYKFQN